MTPEFLARLHARAMQHQAPWVANDFKDLLAQESTFLVHPPVAASGAAQQLKGFALGRIVLDEAELLTLATDPDVRRQGVGRACLAAFEAGAARRGAARAFLEVAVTNAPAIALYRSAGWRENGRRKDYYKVADARIDAVLMTKPLNPA
ncbi:MAG: GNAT family N-acetyltransferase [Silicimonas sp.]|jgi:ribosomal-protein-alanine N-acetyltransferase|nr:GNAT family N-acetyltransferase [Silicimonas sp.]